VPVITAVTASFGLQDGTTVAETVSIGAAGDAFNVVIDSTFYTTNTTQLVDLEGQVYATLTLRDGLVFDLNVPLSVMFHPNFARTYSGAAPTGDTEPLIVWDGPPEEPEFANIVGSGGATMNALDGSTFGIAPVKIVDLQQGSDWGSPPTVLTVGFQLQRLEPFNASLELEVEVARVGHGALFESHLNKARHNMTQRNFVGASWYKQQRNCRRSAWWMRA
jgi:hypothetical protein